MTWRPLTPTLGTAIVLLANGFSTSNQQRATSNEQPATSNEQPATSNQ
jgi:hypothetical protein